MSRRFLVFLCLAGVGFGLLLLPLQRDGLHSQNPSFSESSEREYRRVVSLNGSITEIIYALGMESVLVGTDTSSYYPPQSQKLPKVGYQRALSLEGILSLKPDLVIGTEDAGPPEVLDRLMKLGIRVEILHTEPGFEAAISRIRFVGENLGVNAVADTLIRRIERKATQIQNNPPWKKKPRILMIYSRGKNMLMVAGKKTSGSAMIELVGAENSITEFTGYKPLSPEYILKSKPDAILITDHSLIALGGEEELWKMPGFRQMKQETRPKVLSMDDLLLLGFSSRIDLAMEELQGKIEKSLK